jgi:hypothetical protein
MLPGGELSDLLGRTLPGCQSPLFSMADIKKLGKRQIDRQQSTKSSL